MPPRGKETARRFVLFYTKIGCILRNPTAHGRHRNNEVDHGKPQSIYLYPGYGNGRTAQSRASVGQAGARPGAPRRAAPPARQQPMGDTIILVLLFVVAPLCGLIGVFVPTFLWVFIIVTLLVLAAMWLLKSFEPRGRAFLSGILLVLSAVALIAVIDLSPKQTVYPQYGDGGTTFGTDGAMAQANAQTFQAVGGVSAAPTAPIDCRRTQARRRTLRPHRPPADFSTRLPC